MLVDEPTQSSAEYTAMALRAAGATIAGIREGHDEVLEAALHEIRGARRP